MSFRQRRRNPAAGVAGRRWGHLGADLSSACGGRWGRTLVALRVRVDADLISPVSPPSPSGASLPFTRRGALPVASTSRQKRPGLTLPHGRASAGRVPAAACGCGLPDGRSRAAMHPVELRPPTGDRHNLSAPRGGCGCSAWGGSWSSFEDGRAGFCPDACVFGSGGRWGRTLFPLRVLVDVNAILFVVPPEP